MRMYNDYLLFAAMVIVTMAWSYMIEGLVE